MVNVTKIKDLIKAKGLSQAYVCSKINKRRTYISECALDNDKIDDNTLFQIADILGTTPEYLRDETDDPEIKKFPADEIDEELATYLEELRTRPEMRMIFDITKDATKEDVEKAVRIIEAMLENDKKE